MKKSFVIPFAILFFLIRSACGESVFMRKIIDGDTIWIDGRVKVRFIGVDAPEIYDGKKINWESKKWKMPADDIRTLGRASVKFLQYLFQKAGGGRKIFLKYDRFNVYSGHKDKYGRKLAYIYIPLKEGKKGDPTWVYESIDGKKCVFVNATLIREGYAFVYFFSDYDFKNDFIAYEKLARDEKKGLWENEKKDFFAIWPYMEQMRRPSSAGYKTVF